MQAPSLPRPPPPARRWRRRLAIAGGVVAGLVATGLLVAHFAFADALLAAVLARMEARSGLRLSYGTADLSPLRGRCVLTDVRVLRRDHPAGEVDLSARLVELQIGVWSLLGRDLDVERLAVDELRGRYERARASEGRPFVVRELQLRGASLRVVDRSKDEPHGLFLGLDRLTATSLRRDTLLWDLLLRSDARGRVGRSEFEVSSARDDEGGVATWTLPRIDAADLFARRLPPGSVEGTCGLRVTHRWSGEAPTSARSRWSVSCEGLGLRPGVDATGALGAAGRWLAAKRRPLALDFDLDVGPEHLSGAGAALARPLLHAAGTGAVSALLASLARQTLVDAGTRLLDTARSWRRDRATPRASPGSAPTAVPPPSNPAGAPSAPAGR